MDVGPVEGVVIDVELKPDVGGDLGPLGAPGVARDAIEHGRLERVARVHREVQVQPAGLEAGGIFARQHVGLRGHAVRDCVEAAFVFAGLGDRASAPGSVPPAGLGSAELGFRLGLGGRRAVAGLGCYYHGRAPEFDGSVGSDRSGGFRLWRPAAGRGPA